MRASVVVGFAWTQIIQMRKGSKQVQKFNEDTGVPYMKSEDVTYYSVAGVDFEKLELAVAHVVSKHKLSAFVDTPCTVFGFETGAYLDRAGSIKLTDNDELRNRATNIARSMGATGNADFFLVNYEPKAA